MKTIRLSILLTIAIFLKGAAPLCSAADIKQFKKDMSYYRKVSRTKNLNANDRLYILNLYREKYDKADYDLSDLFAEIDRWSAVRQDEPYNKMPDRLSSMRKGVAYSPTPLQEVTPSTSSDHAWLTRLIIVDAKEFSRLILDVPGATDFREIQDEANLQEFSIELHNTVDELKPSSHKIETKASRIKEVLTGPLETDPASIKVAVKMRQPYTHTIKKKKNQLYVTVYDLKINPPISKISNSSLPVEQAETIVSTLTPSAPALTPDLLNPTPAPNPAPPLNAGSSVINNGDILSIWAAPTENIAQKTVVDVSGNIQLPIIGSIRAAGLNTQSLAEEISNRLKQYVDKPTVRIEIQKISSEQVYLTGRVVNPGSYPYRDSLRCGEFILQSGGFEKDAQKDQITIYRSGKESKETILFNAETYSVSSSSGPAVDFELRPGDIIEVPRSTKFVYIMGAVKNEGQYEYKKDTKLMQMIYLAGGFEKYANLDQVRVVRNIEGKRMVQQINVKTIINNNPDKDISIEPNDLIVVPQKGVFKSKVFNRGLLPWGIFVSSLGLVLILLI